MLIICIGYLKPKHFIIQFLDVKPASNGPNRSDGGGGSAPPPMSGGAGGLGGLFAGGMPKLRPAGERKPLGGYLLIY